MSRKTESQMSSVSFLRGEEIRRFSRVFLRRGPVTIGVIAMLLFLVTSAFGPLFSPYNPYAQDLGNVLSKPSLKHPLGTDSLGRDTLSRLIYGARITLAVGIIAVMIGAVVGSMLGLIAGFFGGWINAIIMRLTDALMAVPPLLHMSTTGVRERDRPGYLRRTQTAPTAAVQETSQAPHADAEHERRCDDVHVQSE